MCPNPKIFHFNLLQTFKLIIKVALHDLLPFLLSEKWLYQQKVLLHTVFPKWFYFVQGWIFLQQPRILLNCNILPYL